MNNTCILCPQFFYWYSIGETVDTEYTYYSWYMTSTDIVKWRKTNDYETFEKGMIMKIWKKGGSREKGGGGNEIHAPCVCDTNCPLVMESNVFLHNLWYQKPVCFSVLFWQQIPIFSWQWTPVCRYYDRYAISVSHMFICAYSFRAPEFTPFRFSMGFVLLNL